MRQSCGAGGVLRRHLQPLLVGGTTDCGGVCVDTLLDPPTVATAAAPAVPVRCALPAPATSRVSAAPPTVVATVSTSFSTSELWHLRACPSDEVCSAGTCNLSCVGGTIDCGGVCVDPLLDPANMAPAGTLAPQVRCAPPDLRPELRRRHRLRRRLCQYPARPRQLRYLWKPVRPRRGLQRDRHLRTLVSDRPHKLQRHLCRYRYRPGQLRRMWQSVRPGEVCDGTGRASSRVRPHRLQRHLRRCQYGPGQLLPAAALWCWRDLAGPAPASSHVRSASPIATAPSIPI